MLRANVALKLQHFLRISTLLRSPHWLFSSNGAGLFSIPFHSRAGYIYSGVSRTCTSCEGKSNTTFYILIAILVVGGILSLLGEVIGDKFAKVDPGSVKVTWNTVEYHINELSALVYLKIGKQGTAKINWMRRRYN